MNPMNPMNPMNLRRAAHEAGGADGPVRVLVADDHDLVRVGLAMILGAQPDIEEVGQAANGHQAVTLARRLQSDVCLFDIRMPERDGIDVNLSYPPDLRRTGATVTSVNTTVGRLRASSADGRPSAPTLLGPVESRAWPRTSPSARHRIGPTGSTPSSERLSAPVAARAMHRGPRRRARASTRSTSCSGA